MAKYRDLTGLKFGRLLVLSRADNKGRAARWNCLCDCGNQVKVYSSSLNSGRTVSCRCFAKENNIKLRWKHGSINNPEYNNWIAMMQRCYNANSGKYKDYGARGITVCDRWSDFSNFYADMGPKPSKNHSIDRIDVNGNYDPSNCRWATPSIQSRNKRQHSNNKSGIQGVRERNGKWIAEISIDKKRIQIGTFEKLESAISARKEAEKKYWNKSS